MTFLVFNPYFRGSAKTPEGGHRHPHAASLRLPPDTPPPPAPPPSVKRSPACDQVTGRGLAARSREAGRASPQLCFALCRSLLLACAFCTIRRAGYKERDGRRAVETEHESDGASGRTRGDLTGPRSGPRTDNKNKKSPGPGTELRRCTHWILPTKECRDQGERGGLYRAGTGFCLLIVLIAVGVLLLRPPPPGFYCYDPPFQPLPRPRSPDSRLRSFFLRV